MRNTVVVMLLLLIISFPAVKSLLAPGGFTSHDLTHHVIRQISMDRLLSEGQFPPRWSGELNNGFGYPLFLFNYPLPALIGEGFHKIGFDFVDSVKAVLFTSMIISILGMYLFLNSLLRLRLAAFLGAVFYLYAPLRFLNVYVSAAVGSALALGVLPFVFWSMVEIKKGESVKGKGERWVLLGALVFALLILAHNITALIFSSLIIGFAGLLVWEAKDRLRVFRGFGVMFLLGLSLSAWFWLPALVEKQYILFDEIYSGFYKNQFISLWQLIRSPWGYGLSHPQNPEPGDMSYQLGLAQIGVMVLLAGGFGFFRKVREFRVIGGTCLGLFVLSVFLMLPMSSVVWDRLPFLSLVQFPLRFSALSIFSAGVAVALLIKYLPLKKIFFLTLLVLVIYANRNHWNINEKFDPGESYYLNLKTTATSYGEHLPRWGRIMDKKAPAKLEMIGGSGKIRMFRDLSGKVLAEVEAGGAVKVRLNQFYFPGWRIWIDGQSVSVNYLVDGESYGLPVFEVPVGKHQIVAEFKNTADRSIADGISTVSVVLWLGWLCKLLLKNS